MKNVRYLTWAGAVWLCLVILGVPALAIVPPGADCDWQRGDPHKMHWPQLPDLTKTAVDVDFRPTLADDFLCGQSGPITDIHLWAGFASDVIPGEGPGDLVFELSLYADIPATADRWSRPGELLWSQMFSPGQYNVRPLASGPVGWFMPLNGVFQPEDHWRTYQFNFCITEEPFVQTAGTVYWLGVKVFDAAGNEIRFGWRNTLPRWNWNDAAVVLDTTNQWQALHYPEEHPWAGQPLHLAFVITGDPTQEPRFDLGDAPDSSNSSPGTPMTAYPSPLTLAHYPTVYSAGSPPVGPLHHDPTGLAYLGPKVTLEQEADLGPDQDPTNNILPRLDSPNRDGADDSVQLPLFLPSCQATNFTYTVTVTSLAQPEVYVNVWFDFNRDGDWDDRLDCPDGTAVEEWAVQNQAVPLTALGSMTVTTPSFLCWNPLSQDEKNPLWMRITLAEVPWDPTAFRGGAGPVGGYRYGETEDYLIYPEPDPSQDKLDWGDAPDSVQSPGYPTLAIHNGASHVADGPWFGDRSDQPDPDTDGQPHVNSLGDDLDVAETIPNDDEDGVGVSTAPLVPGTTGDVSVQVNGGGGIVQAWIDFNADGTWQASEQIYNGFLPDGVHTLSFPVPAAAVSGLTHGRFRISRNGGLSPTGPAPDGEVEDHLIPIWEIPPHLKWLQLPDTTRNGIDVRLSPVPGAVPHSLADDFECTCYGRITDIHLWGSWKDDKKGQIQRIRVRFRPDDPVGAGGADPSNPYSKPGPEVLWEHTFVAGDFTENLYHQLVPPGEFWWDPISGELLPGGDRQIWELHLKVDPNEAFLQEGRPDKPIIYWLEVQVETEDGEFGWKTRRWPEHFMDDAVLRFAGNDQELRYPQGHPYADQEQNSLDLAFYLTCRPEPHDVPTFLPASVTQCPPVVTQCPPVPTRCRPVQTRCPAVRTQCPAAATKCPPVKTFCAAKKTKCPALATRCPVVKTRCPAVSTLCPTVSTQCPPVATECYVEETKCPPVATQCPPVLTECPPVATECVIQETACHAADTYCPAVATQCPPVQTQCPPLDTYCPPQETKCYTRQTYCPPVETQCPTLQTQCPPMATECHVEETVCPPVETHCPPTYTQCPPTATKCPAVATRCPPAQTKCPAIATECLMEETVCPPVQTQCPPVQTECPPVATECFVEETVCPPVETQCPALQTQCPPVATECFAEETFCPPVETRCPPVETECPPVQTRCPPLLTECPPTATLCVAQETFCPALPTLCPVVLTQCSPLGGICDPTGGGGGVALTAPQPQLLDEPTCPTVEADCPEVSVAAAQLTRRWGETLALRL